MCEDDELGDLSDAALQFTELVGYVDLDGVQRTYT